MGEYSYVKRSPFYRIMHGLNKENLSDHKVAMIKEVDMTSAESLRATLEKGAGVRPTYTALVIKAISLALREHPHANRVPIGPWFWKRIIQLEHVDMTVAVERDQPGIEQAAFAGTIRHTDELDLVQITRELRSLANATPETNPRWRAFNWICRSLPAPMALFVLSLPRMFPGLWIQHRGGAVMVSSPAKYGVDLMMGAWPWPLGFSFGFVKPRPFVRNEKLAICPTMLLTLSFDRRLIAGAPAARFFQATCELLETATETLLQPRDAAATSSELNSGSQ